MALNRSLEFKGVIIQTVFVVEIPFESACALVSSTRSSLYLHQKVARLIGIILTFFLFCFVFFLFSLKTQFRSLYRC